MVASYVTDTTQYFYLDPTHRQYTDYFFIKSTINTKDQQWDIFEWTELDTEIFEASRYEKQTKWIDPKIEVKDRTYTSLYLRADSS